VKFPSFNDRLGTVGPLRVNDTDLIWSQSLTGPTGFSLTTMHVASPASLNC
jgi:hypothetical protein